SHAGPVIAWPPGQSACVNGLPSVLRFPNTLKHLRVPVYGVPSGFLGGVKPPPSSGLPAVSTTAIVAVAALARNVRGNGCASALFHASKYRKMPCRAVSVRTGVVTVCFVTLIFWSHNAKKNVFSLIIGPP